MLQAWGTCICCMMCIELFQSVIFTDWNNLDYEHELSFFFFFLFSWKTSESRMESCYLPMFINFYPFIFVV